MANSAPWQSFLDYLKNQVKKVPPPTPAEVEYAKQPFSSRTEPPKDVV